MNKTVNNIQLNAMTQSVFGCGVIPSENINNNEVCEAIVTSLAALNYVKDVYGSECEDPESAKQDFLAGVQWARNPYTVEVRQEIRKNLHDEAKETGRTLKETALLSIIDEYDHFRDVAKTFPRFCNIIDNIPYGDDLSKKVKNKSYKTVLDAMKILNGVLYDLHDSIQKAVVVLEEGAKA